MPLEEMLILTTPPDRLAQARQTGLTLGHTAYRLGRGGHLYRSGNSASIRGGLMVVESAQPPPTGDPGTTCQQILRECTGRSFSGVICQFAPSPFTQRLVKQLDSLLPHKRLSLLVPEAFAQQVQHALILISSALSGGSYTRRLEEAGQRFGGPGRLALLVERVAEDFRLPSPTGCGTALTRQALADQISQRATCVFFSDDLCQRYFTYMSRENGAHFVLFDDGASLRKKLHIARQLGICRAVGSFEQLDDLLEEVLS